MIPKEGTADAASLSVFVESLNNCIDCTFANFVSGVAQVRRCFEDVVRTFCVKEEAPVSLDTE